MAYFTKREDPVYKQFTFLGAMVLGWNVFQALYLGAIEIHMAEFLFNMQMLFIPYISVALLMCILKAAYPDRNIPIKYLALLFALPSITVVINFTNDFHHLFRTEFAILETIPAPVLINERGPWFWIHTFYSYVVIASASLIALYKIRITEKPYRLQYYMILLGIMLSIFTNMIMLFFARIGPIDNTLWGLSFGLFFFYFSLDTSPTSNYILARNEVFESIGEYIFVLNMTGSITDINRPARNWLLKHSIDSNPATFDKLLEQFQNSGAIIENDESTGWRELFFPARNGLLFNSFAIKEQSIYNKKNTAVGTIVTFSDMSAIRETLRSLQDISTKDTLTGIHNRRAYEKELEDCEKNNILPLCIVAGDVNGLKMINDTFGHLCGDQTLRIAASLISECVREKGTVARIGGDEFAIIAPGYNEKAAEALTEDIKEAFANKSEALHGAGIALGYAIKVDLKQKLTEIMNEADKKMYQDKRNDRRRNSIRQ